MKNSISLFLLMLGFHLHAQDFTQVSPFYAGGSFAIADFDGDSDEDIFCISYYFNDPSDIFWLENNGATPLYFDSHNLGFGYGARANPAAADYDGDGDMDILMAKGNDLDIIIYVSDGNGAFQEAFVGESGTYDFSFQDLEGDGDLDFIGANPDFGVLDIYVNNGSQSFTKTNLINSTAPLFYRYAATDFDADGDIDIVAGYKWNISGKHLEVLMNEGNNTFTATTLAVDDFKNLHQVAVADLNKDGNLDIGAVNNEGLTGWMGNGNFGFTRQPLVSYTGTSIFGFLSLDLLDINGDDVPDPVMGDNDGEISWYKNTDVTTLQYEKLEVANLSPCYTIKHADFDLDGDNDLVITNGESIRVYENNVPQISALKESSPYAAFDVFPNPSRGFINLRTQAPGQYSYELHDLQGVKIRSGKVLSEQLSLAPLALGTYILSVLDDITGQRVTGQIVKI